VTATYLVVAVALLIANGFFVGAEFALIAARRTRIEQLSAEGNARAATALASIRELSFMLAGAQLGITMASLGLGFVAEPAVAHAIESGLQGVVDLPEGLLHSISFVVALGIVVFFHMVVGEMAPKNIAIAEPERTALWLALPMRLYVNVLRPFIHLLNALANGALRLMRVEPIDEVTSVHTSQEIATMIVEAGEGGMLEEFKQHLLSGAIELGARDAGAAMVPRTEITAVPSTATPADVERVVVESGHSRIPVFSEDIDHVLGFIHAKDLLRVPDNERGSVLRSDLFRQMLIVPESRKLRPLLIDMRRERRHLALVIDEHGGTAGIVTLEDLLEELVGEIRDEYDVRELGVERLDERRYLVPGSLRIDETATRLGVELPEGDYETVAGFLMDRLGRIPTRRDAVEHDGWRLRVRSMQRRRIVQVLIEPARGRSGPAEASARSGNDDA
jgi:CBS domain containing-hemolysin-like protein